MTTTHFTQQIRQLIAADQLPVALEKMRLFAKKTPLLNDVLQQSGRLAHIRQQNNLGLVTHNEATLEQNRIRYGLLELLNDLERNGTPPQPFDALLAAVEQESARPEVQAEVANAINIVNSKNVVVGSTISAGRDVIIGDLTTVTESQTSRRLRLFLYLFVPFLALGGAFLWYRMQPITLIVAVDNRTPNPELPFQKGNLTLAHDGKMDIETIETNGKATFISIRRGEKVTLHFTSEGFVPVDTAFVLSREGHLALPIRRDDSFATFSGFIIEATSDATTGKPLEGVKVSIPCCQTVTDAFGKFEFKIPPEHQRETQPFQISKEGYEPQSLTLKIPDHTDPSYRKILTPWYWRNLTPCTGPN